MITAGGRAAIFLVLGHALVPSPHPAAKAMMQVGPASDAQTKLAESLPILPSTTADQPKPADDRAEPAPAGDVAAPRRPASEGARRPNRESDVSPAGMRDWLSGMAIGGAAVLVVWAVIHWLRAMKRTRSRANRGARGSSARSSVDAEEERRLAARRETLGRLEIAEADAGSDPPSSAEQADSDVSLDRSRQATTGCERAALLGDESQASGHDGNGPLWAGRGSVEGPSEIPPSVERLLEGWDVAFRQGDLDACRRAMTALVGRIEAKTTEHLREETERMSQELEASLRERFSVCVRDLDYRGALAVGCEIKRQLPASSIATDFDRIHPYLLRRIERAPT